MSKTNQDMYNQDPAVFEAGVTYTLEALISYATLAGADQLAVWLKVMVSEFVVVLDELAKRKVEPCKSNLN